MAVDLGGAKQVGWRNPRTGILHPLKLGVHPAADWEPLYVSDETPTPEYLRLIEVIRQAQLRNRALLNRSKRLRRHIRELETTLKGRTAQLERLRFSVGELEEMLAATRIRLDDWREVANDRTRHILKLSERLDAYEGDIERWDEFERLLARAKEAEADRNQLRILIGEWQAAHAAPDTGSTAGTERCLAAARALAEVKI